MDTTTHKGIKHVSAGRGDDELRVVERQWEVRPNNSYTPAGATIRQLPPGNYWTQVDVWGTPFLQRRAVNTDSIIELADQASTQVIEVIRTFWHSREHYQARGLLFKRGILMHGPPGSGKSITVRLLCRDLMKMGGVVVHPTPNVDIEYTNQLLQSTRQIEPDRPIIVVLEDIDELLASRRNAEHSILAMLDGELQVDNICYLATTNYLDNLGERIINRPSRFDQRIHIDMPNSLARHNYLQHVMRDLDNAQLAQWVSDTAGLSIAHLRELVSAVCCLQQPYEDVIERLHHMHQLEQ